MSEVALTADRQTLPAGWRWARLGEVAVLNPRRPTLRRANSALTTFLPMSAVGVNGQGIEASEARPYGDVAKGYSYFAEGDVLFAKITPCMQNGKHTIARGLRDGIGFGSTEFHVVRPATDITPEWILNFLRQPRVLKDATAHFTGAVGQQRVPAAYLANLNLPLPPLPEQHRIVARLTEQLAEAERAQAAVEAQQAAARALPAAYLREVFPRPGGSLPSGWRWVRLGEEVEFLDSRRVPVNVAERTKRVAGKTHDALYPYFGANGQVGWIDGYLFDEPLVLLAEDGGAFGSTDQPISYQVEGRVWVNNHAHVLRPRNGVDPAYLGFVLRIRPDVAEFVAGSTRPKLTQAMAARIPLPLPPFPEQRRIGDWLTAQMAEAERMAAALDRTQALVDAVPPRLLQDALTGGL